MDEQEYLATAVKTLDAMLSVMSPKPQEIPHDARYYDLPFHLAHLQRQAKHSLFSEQAQTLWQSIEVLLSLFEEDKLEYRHVQAALLAARKVALG